MTETQFSLPKHADGGSLQMQWQRCGKPWCGCSSGTNPHGPYFYFRWRENGRQRKRYVKAEQLAEALKLIEMQRQHIAPVSTIRRSLKRVNKEYGYV